MRIRLLLILSCLIFQGCRSESPNPSRLIQVQLGGVPVSLDPAKAEDGLSLRVLANLMEGLLGYDGRGQLQKFLASSVEISSDQKRYVVTLRPHAKWSDGRPILPSDFILGFKRALAPTMPSKLAESFMVIRGARAYRLGKTLDLPGICENDGKLIFELERPVSFFLHLLTLPVALPVRQDVLDAHQGRWPEGEQWSQVFTTGPYRVASFVHDQKITLERNPYYWGTPAPIESIEWKIISDEIVGMRLFEQGKLDILTKIPSLSYERLSREGKVSSFPFLATYYIGMNCRKPPFNDREFRRAVAAVIHRKEIVAALMTGEHPARTWIPQGLEGFLSDEEAAAAWGSDSSGVLKTISSVRTQTAKLEPIVLQFDSSERNAMIIEKIEQDLKQNLGMHLSLVNLDWKSHLQSVHSDPPQLFRLAWQTPFLDPIFHLQVMTSRHPANPTGCSDPKYDRLVDAIESEKPGRKREQLIAQAQKLLIQDEAWVIPIYHYVQNYAVSPRIKNFSANPFGVIRLNELEVIRDGFQK